MTPEPFNILGSIFNPAINSKIMPLASIMFDKALQTATVKKYRITEGELVYVDENGKLQDCPGAGKANYCITGCYGTIINTDLHFVAINLKTRELIRINL